MRHIAQASSDWIATDLKAIERRCGEIEAAVAVRPDVFLVYHDMLDAARRSDIAAVDGGFADLLRAVIETPPQTIRNYADPSFGPAELDRYRRAFAVDADTTIALIPAEPADFEQACAALTGAKNVLAASDAEHLGEILALVKEVVFGAGRVGEGMTFDGVTSFVATGSLLLNANEHRTVPGAFAGLVHEAAHALIFAYSGGEALVENSIEERYSSPLRPDPRPMDGIFHATFVSARMAYALDRALTAGTFARNDQEEARLLLAGARRAWDSGYATVRDHGRPTPLGQTLMRSAAEHLT